MHRGDIVAVVDTDKAEIEIEVFEDGVVEELLVQPGERVPVGTPLATIRRRGGAGRARPRGAAHPRRRPPAPVAAPHAGRRQPAPRRRRTRARAARRPRRRRTARRRAVARRLAATRAGTRPSATSRRRRPWTGSGPAGGAALARRRAAPAAPSRRPPSPTARPRCGRRSRAAMARSKREIPHYYLATPIDMSAALAWLERRQRSAPVAERLLPAVLLLKATALAAREVPELNGFWIDDALRSRARASTSASRSRCAAAA